MARNEFIVEARIKERSSNHYVKVDEITGTPQKVGELLLEKYGNKKTFFDKIILALDIAGNEMLKDDKK